MAAGRLNVSFTGAIGLPFARRGLLRWAVAVSAGAVVAVPKVPSGRRARVAVIAALLRFCLRGTATRPESASVVDKMDVLQQSQGRRQNVSPSLRFRSADACRHEVEIAGFQERFGNFGVRRHLGIWDRVQNVAEI